MILIVAAGDDFADEKKTAFALDYWLGRSPIAKVVLVRRPGRPDRFCEIVETWAKSRMVLVAIEAATDEEWKKEGHKVGRVVNRRALNKHRPDRILVFPGRGAVDELLHQARAAGLKCIEVA